MRRAWKLLALAVLVTVCVAGVTQEAYNTLRSAPSAYRTSTLDGDDSTDWTAPISTGQDGTVATITSTWGNPTVIAPVTMTAPGSTSTVRCGLYVWDGSSYTCVGIAGVSTATTGMTTLDGASYVTDSPLLFDTAGATHVELRITDPLPAGTTLELHPYVFGAVSQ